MKDVAKDCKNAVRKLKVKKSADAIAELKDFRTQMKNGSKQGSFNRKQKSKIRALNRLIKKLIKARKKTFKSLKRKTVKAVKQLIRLLK